MNLLIIVTLVLMLLLLYLLLFWLLLLFLLLLRPLLLLLLLFTHYHCCCCCCLLITLVLNVIYLLTFCDFKLNQMLISKLYIKLNIKYYIKVDILKLIFFFNYILLIHYYHWLYYLQVFISYTTLTVLIN